MTLPSSVFGLRWIFLVRTRSGYSPFDGAEWGQNTGASDFTLARVW